MTPAQSSSGRLRGRFLAVLTVVATLVLVLPPLPASAAGGSPGDVIFAQTNQARAQQGLPPLRRSAALDIMATAWAQHMAAVNTMSHNPQLASQLPAGWTRAEENVANGFDYTRVLPAWLASPGHYANIMGPTTDIGIGYVVDASGRAWAVQDFGAYAVAPGLPAAGAPPARRSAPVPAPAPVPARPPAQPVPAAPAPAPVPVAPVVVPVAPPAPIVFPRVRPPRSMEFGPVYWILFK